MDTTGKKQTTQPDISAILASCPLPITNYSEVTLAHGSGGKLTQQLIEKMIRPQFSNPFLDPLHDGAVVPFGEGRLAFSTDSFVVDPIFFPGGDIGKLAVHGTVNDIAMCGAKPLFLSAAFILEEGIPMEDLWRVILSMQEAAAAAGVKFVTGDTKVVDRGKGDLIYINTSGIGVVPDDVHIDRTHIRAGDKVLINGPIAAHGMAIMSVREGLQFETEIVSDSAALHDLVASMLNANSEIRVLRDPTRGGVASALSEIVMNSPYGIHLHEKQIPVQEEVKSACEMLGLDPLHVANEGKVIAIVPGEATEGVLAAMHAHPLGRDSAVIGEVVDDRAGRVTMQTLIGGTRIVDMLSGEQLPRIC